MERTETEQPDLDKILHELVTKMRDEAGDDWYWFNREIDYLKPKIDNEKAKVFRAFATIQKALDRLQKLEARYERAMEAKAEANQARSQGSA